VGAARRLRTLMQGTAAEEKDGGAGDPEAEPEAEPFFEEVSGDDPIVLELEERLQKMMGKKDLTLDMVLNPGTIVNTEREVILLRAELRATPDEETETRKALEDKIEEKQMKVVNEMRQVMTDNLKLEFIAEAAIAVPLFASFCYDAFPWYPDLRWLGLSALGTKVAFRIFGLWGVWLVVVPALRARKPGGPYGMGYEEKRALDTSFLVLPFVCFFVPFFNKEPATTFWLSLLALGALYLWSFNTPLNAQEAAPLRVRGAAQNSGLPPQVEWALRALDFGTGSERGARSEDVSWQQQLDAYEAAAAELAAAKAELKTGKKTPEEMPQSS